MTAQEFTNNIAKITDQRHGLGSVVGTESNSAKTVLKMRNEELAVKASNSLSKALKNCVVGACKNQVEIFFCF